MIADTDDLDRAGHAIAVNERRRATNVDPVNGVAGLVQIDGDEVSLVIVERVHGSVLGSLRLG